MTGTEWKRSGEERVRINKRGEVENLNCVQLERKKVTNQ